MKSLQVVSERASFDILETYEAFDHPCSDVFQGIEFCKICALLSFVEAMFAAGDRSLGSSLHTWSILDNRISVFHISHPI